MQLTQTVIQLTQTTWITQLSCTHTYTHITNFAEDTYCMYVRSSVVLVLNTTSNFYLSSSSRARTGTGTIKLCFSELES